MPLPTNHTLAASKTMSVAEAKAHFSAMISSVEEQHHPITILRRGKPIAQVVPLPASPAPTLNGSMAGTVRLLGDIVSPIWDEWTVSDEKTDGK